MNSILALMFLLMVVLGIAVGYLFWTVGNLLEAVTTLQKSELTRQEELLEKIKSQNI